MNLKENIVLLYLEVEGVIVTLLKFRK